jgi:hypothetical protein
LLPLPNLPQEGSQRGGHIPVRQTSLGQARSTKATGLSSPWRSYGTSTAGAALPMIRRS